MIKKKILVCDDEKDIVDVLSYNLEKQGFSVVKAFNGAEALEKVNEDIDVIILDVMMPYLSGLEVCQRIKSNSELSKIPIIFLTAKDSELDEIKGLEIGADDYITKPISINKLLARINAILRRTDSLHGQKIIELGEISLDIDNYEVIIDNSRQKLPRKEFEILLYLVNNKGKIVRREKLLENVWGNDIYVGHRTIDVHIRRIREKLGKFSDLIETIKGVGYRFRGVSE